MAHAPWNAPIKNYGFKDCGFETASGARVVG